MAKRRRKHSDPILDALKAASTNPPPPPPEVQCELDQALCVLSESVENNTRAAERARASSAASGVYKAV